MPQLLNEVSKQKLPDRAGVGSSWFEVDERGKVVVVAEVATLVVVDSPLRPASHSTKYKVECHTP